MRTVRAFSKELTEVQTYGEKVEDVLRLAKKEALLSAGFFGMVCLSKTYLQISPVHVEKFYLHHIA